MTSPVFLSNGNRYEAAEVSTPALNYESIRYSKHVIEAHSLMVKDKHRRPFAKLCDREFSCNEPEFSHAMPILDALIAKVGRHSSRFLARLSFPTIPHTRSINSPLNVAQIRFWSRDRALKLLVANPRYSFPSARLHHKRKYNCR